MLKAEQITRIKKIIKDKNLTKKSLGQIADENNIIIKIGDLDNIKDKISLSGAIIKDGDVNYSIYVNKNDSEARQNFTIAHELGHYFLHKKELDELSIISDKKECQYLYRDTDFDCVPDEIKWMEEEANEFAGNLLMPEEKFLELYKEYTIPQLAKIFSVSERAISTRFYYLSKRHDK